MSRPVRVGVDLTPLLGPPSGIHQITRGLVDALAARDDIVLSGWLLSARGRRPEVEFSVRRSLFPARLAQRFWTKSWCPPGRFITGPVDVAHGTNFIAPPSPKSVVSIQDLTPITHPEWVQPEVAAKAAPLQFAIKRGATVHCSSQAVADEVASVLGVDLARIAVVHHGVTPVGPGDRHRAESLAGGGRYVLALGTVEKRKNIPTLVALMPTLPRDVRLVIAGPIGNDEDLVHHEIEASPARERIRRIPTLGEHDRASLLRSAAVLAFPSHHEGFGLPPLEALEVGTPVVASAVGVLPEILGDRLDLITPGDMVAFAESITAVLDDPCVDPEAVARVKAMTWQRAAMEMTEVYRSLA